MSALAKALLEFQRNAPDIQRDAINPHFRNKYVSLETLMDAVVPKLNAVGLVVSQMPTTVENGEGPRPALRTKIIHADSGEELEDVMLLMPGKEDPQGQGSAITYARRYSLMAALGLVADEDDDGNAASRSAAGKGTDGIDSSGSAADAARRAQAAAEKAGAQPPFSEARPTMTEAQYLELSRRSQAADAKPSEVVVHFGKNKGVLLGELTPSQLRWYATDWKLQDTPSEYDHRLKAAAVALHANDDRPLGAMPDDEIPFS